jgi:hypothetical protein
MAITTFDERSLALSASRRTSLIARLFRRLASARQETADRDILEHLLSLDDRTLEAHGYTRKALRLRSGG